MAKGIAVLKLLSLCFILQSVSSTSLHDLLHSQHDLSNPVATPFLPKQRLEIKLKKRQSVSSDSGSGGGSSQSATGGNGGAVTAGSSSTQDQSQQTTTTPAQQQTTTTTPPAQSSSSSSDQQQQQQSSTTDPAGVTTTPASSSNPVASTPTSTPAASSSNSVPGNAATSLPSSNSVATGLSSGTSSGTSTVARASASDLTTTFTSIFTNSDGTTSTSTGVQTIQTGGSNKSSSSSSGKTWGIVGGVVGGVVAVAGIVFLVWRFTQKRFSDLDHDADEIKWPELQPDGQEMSAVASTLNPLGTNPTGRAGFGDDNEGSEWGDGPRTSRSGSRMGMNGSNGSMSALNGIGVGMDPNNSYEQLGMYDHPTPGGAYYDPYLGPSSAPYPPPQTIYPPPPSSHSSPVIPPGAYSVPNSSSQHSPSHSLSSISKQVLPPIPTGTPTFTQEEVAFNGTGRTPSLASGMSDPFRRSGTPLDDGVHEDGRGPLEIVNGRPESIASVASGSVYSRSESRQDWGRTSKNDH